MNKVDKVMFDHKVDVTFLPKEPLFGIKGINCEVLCIDDVYRPVYGFEIGLLFFKFSYVHLFWKD
jgi:hypothetical protein